MISQATLQLLVQLKDEASDGLGSLGGALGTLGTAGLAVAAAGVAALSVAIVGGVADAQEARALYASTEQTITSMGNAAGRSADDVVALASKLSDAAGMSLFGDDQIQQSENLLLTFGEIKGETFDLATALTVDLAAALGGAPADSAMMLGKALNDPIHGMSALGKAGLTFSEEQKAAITAMQESGDMAGAQAIIIAELNKQVGGQAEAQAKAAGGMVQFKAAMGETFETIGEKLLPILDKLGAWLNSPDVQAAISVFAERLGTGIQVAADFLVNDLIPAVTDLYNFLAPILGPIIAEVARALSEDLPRGIDRVVTAWNTMKQALSDFRVAYIDPIVAGWNAITAAVSGAFTWFDSISAKINSISIPDWLQGHSPPPMADWFGMISAAAGDGSLSLGKFLDTLSANAIGGVKSLFGVDQSDLDRYLESVKRTGDVANDWITHLPEGARDAARQMGDALLGGGAPMPASGAAGGGASSTTNIYITVQGSVTTEGDLIRKVRDGLSNLGRQNVNIFGDVTA